MNIKKIATDYSEYTGLRHCSISDNSGEHFYHNYLNGWFKECFENGQELLVDLDFVDGYASSFLDEAFGNLVYDFTLPVVQRLVRIKSDQEPHWKSMIQEQTYLEWEQRRLMGQAPIVTANHTEWYKLVNNTLTLKVWEVPSPSAS